jgi:hypothetical protein
MADALSLSQVHVLPVTVLLAASIHLLYGTWLCAGSWGLPRLYCHCDWRHCAQRSRMQLHRLRQLLTQLVEGQGRHSRSVSGTGTAAQMPVVVHEWQCGVAVCGSAVCLRCSYSQQENTGMCDDEQTSCTSTPPTTPS